MRDINAVSRCQRNIATQNLKINYGKIEVTTLFIEPFSSKYMEENSYHCIFKSFINIELVIESLKKS